LIIKDVAGGSPDRIVASDVESARSSVGRVAAWPTEDTLLFERGGLARPSLWHLVLSPDTSVAIEYVQTDAGLASAQVSRQRDLVVFQEGSGAVWVRDYPVVGPPTRISAGNGSNPRWSPDGLTIYYWSRPVATGDWMLLAARLQRSPTLAVRRTDTIYRTPVFGSWDLYPDGQRFLLAEPVVDSTPPPPAPRERFSLMTNFVQELKRLAPK
jgi:hypothetical protein